MLPGGGAHRDLLPSDDAGINDDVLAGDAARFVGGEEQRRARDIFRLQPELQALQVEEALVVLDAVHLGLGTDGHTASLFAGDPALKVKDRAVALTAEHSGYSRMTLTLPVINLARSIIWFVTGADKAGVLADLYAGGAPFPAARVARVRAVIVADGAAAKEAAAPKKRRAKAKSKVVPLRRRS